MSVLNVTEWHALKWLILCYMNFTSINKNILTHLPREVHHLHAEASLHPCHVLVEIQTVLGRIAQAILCGRRTTLQALGPALGLVQLLGEPLTAHPA